MVRRRGLLAALGGLLAAAGCRRGAATVDDRLAEHGATVRQRLGPDFAAAGLTLPPARVRLVYFKDQRALDVHAAPAGGALRRVRRYPVLAASGGPGPKLREGDRQVPEGIYGIESLNPNSAFHLSLRVGYPSAFDRARAREEGRSQLGGDIMIHGGAASIGCIAIGDEGAEDLFVLAAWTGLARVDLLSVPTDLRVNPAPAPAGAPPWLAGLYAQLAAELRSLPSG